jgi:phage terminase small subunit
MRAMTKTTLATRHLTDLQAAFVANYVETGDSHKAALQAGYAPATARTAGTEILRVPHVAQAVARAVAQRLAMSAPMALAVIEELSSNADISPKVRLDASKALLDRAGFVPPRAAANNVGKIDTPLHEMSVDELKTLAARLENELAERATDVSGATLVPEPAAADLLG